MIKERLEALYAKIPPTPECIAGCSKCCTQVPMLPIEAEVLGLDYCATPSEGGICTLLKDGRCSVYKNRPFICRVYNVTKSGCEMSCPVMNEHGDISQGDSDVLFKEYFEILDIHSDDDKERFELAWAESESVMKAHSASNGWQ